MSGSEDLEQEQEQMMQDEHDDDGGGGGGGSTDSDDDNPGDEYEDEEDDDDSVSQKMEELRGMMDSFYPFHSNPPLNSIDKLLADPSPRVESLMDVDDFMPDLRRGKTKLLEFLMKPNVMSDLITYVSAEKYPAHVEVEKHKRYAHLAYEAIQTDPLKEVLINDDELLDKFFSFLDIVNEMDPLRCAYFSRIVELVFERSPKKLLAYLRKKNNIVARFAWHVNNQYIVESLFRLIDSQMSHQWLHEEDLIPLLMYKMAESEDPETQEKTAAVFAEILDLFVPFPYSILTTQMFHSEIVADQWDQFTFRDLKDHRRVLNGLTVAIGILNLSYEGNMSDETPIFMRTVIGRLNEFVSLLRAAPEPERSFAMTFGTLKPPFGFLRLKVLEFINALVNTRYRAVLDALWREDFFTILLDAVVTYRWNNVVHYFIDQIMTTMIALDGNGERVAEVLVGKCRLAARLSEMFNNETDRSCAYLGQMLHVAQELQKAAVSSEKLRAALAAVPEWIAVENGKLKDMVDAQSRPLVERPPELRVQPEGYDYGLSRPGDFMQPHFEEGGPGSDEDGELEIISEQY